MSFSETFKKSLIVVHASRDSPQLSNDRSAVILRLTPVIVRSIRTCCTIDPTPHLPETWSQRHVHTIWYHNPKWYPNPGILTPTLTVTRKQGFAQHCTQ